MTSYPVAKAKERLSQLIDEVLDGKPVTITRHGKPVVELHAATSASVERPSPELLDEIASFARTLPRMKQSSVDLIRQMRDEE